MLSFCEKFDVLCAMDELVHCISASLPFACEDRSCGAIRDISSLPTKLLLSTLGIQNFCDLLLLLSLSCKLKSHASLLSPYCNSLALPFPFPVTAAFC